MNKMRKGYYQEIRNLRELSMISDPRDVEEYLEVYYFKPEEGMP